MNGDCWPAEYSVMSELSPETPDAINSSDSEPACQGLQQGRIYDSFLEAMQMAVGGSCGPANELTKCFQIGSKTVNRLSLANLVPSRLDNY